MAELEDSRQDLQASRSPRQWSIAASLALLGALNPLPVPLTGLHKLYLGQPFWGGVYFLLGWTPIPRVACVVEGVWYLLRARTGSPMPWPEWPPRSAQATVLASEQTQAIAAALREWERLRQEGLISEQEFEHNRRRLLDKLN